ncbi:MAG: RluA family pseudouridine synthase, partial [Clostridia bacterium]|nr:RluA family pseudouridine synthase [Clostridia bacterium]
MKSFTVTKNDANQRLDKFISKAVPLLPQALMYKYIRLKRIKVNGKRAEISTRIALGDTVDM